MAVQAGIKIDGIVDLQKVFDELLPNEARNLNRATLHAVAGQIAKEAKASAPVESGNLRRSIKAKRRRPQNPDKPFSDVVAGAFYWRFLEYGTKDQAARPFFSPAVNRMRANITAIYKEQFAKKLAQKIKRDAKKRNR